MRFCSTHLFFLLAFFYLHPTAKAEAETEICPRPPMGGVVNEPESLGSLHGALNLEFRFRSFLDVYGLTRYCYLYTDRVQAPTLRVHPGDELVLKLKNELPSADTPPGPVSHVHDSARSCGSSGRMTPDSTNLHFHGMTIPPKCHQDETLRTLIQSSDAAYEYRFRIPVNETPGLYWYHPHPHGHSEKQVLGGASGALIVEGIEKVCPKVANLPERVLVLRDQNVPGAVEGPGESEKIPGRDISLNFVPVMYPLFRPAVMNVRPKEREFWRVLNAAADTYFDLQVLQSATIQEIGDPQPLELVAVDGVTIGASGGTRTNILLAPGARAEFIVTTPPTGTYGQIVTRKYDTGPDGEPVPYRVIANIVSNPGAPPAHSVMPGAPALAEPQRFAGLASLPVAKERKLYFSEVRGNPNDPSSPIRYFITEGGAKPKMFDMNFKKADITVQQGTLEDWTVENRAREAHAFHIHQLHFQLLERDGQKVAEAMLRDTIDVPFWDGKGPYPSVKLRMDLRDPNIAGTFVYHCHILEHEDGGMMGAIEVVVPKH